MTVQPSQRRGLRRVTAVPWPLMAVGLWMLVCASASLGAQSRRVINPADTAWNEANCRLLAPAIRAQRTDREAFRNLHAVNQCPATGPALIAEAWNARSNDSVFVGALLYHSRVLNDRRIAAALLTVLEDNQAERWLRLRTLEAMASQLAPGLVLELGTLIEQQVRNSSGGMSTVRMVSGGSLSIQDFFVGREEMDPGTRATYEDALRRLAESDTTIGNRISTTLKIVADFSKAHPPP